MKLKKLFFSNIFLSILIVSSILSVIVGTTSAMLTVSLSEKTNVFTFSNISIKLVEEKWSALDNDDKIVYPSREVPKDPKIINNGSNDLYVYLKVTVPKNNIRLVDDNDNILDVCSAELFEFEINDGWSLMDQSESEDGMSNIRYYAYTKQPLAPGSETPTLFKDDKVRFVNMLEGEIPMNTKLEMPVIAYAIQSDALPVQGDDVLENMRAAFELLMSSSE